MGLKFEFSTNHCLKFLGCDLPYKLIYNKSRLYMLNTAAFKFCAFLPIAQTQPMLQYVLDITKISGT